MQCRWSCFVLALVYDGVILLSVSSVSQCSESWTSAKLTRTQSSVGLAASLAAVTSGSRPLFYRALVETGQEHVARIIGYEDLHALFLFACFFKTLLQTTLGCAEQSWQQCTEHAPTSGCCWLKHHTREHCSSRFLTGWVRLLLCCRSLPLQIS